MYKGVRFLALADGQEVGRCECQIDLTHGGALPALAGWAELCELQVDAASRNQGIGSWLVARGSCDRRRPGCGREAATVSCWRPSAPTRAPGASMSVWDGRRRSASNAAGNSRCRRWYPLRRQVWRNTSARRADRAPLSRLSRRALLATTPGHQHAETLLGGARWLDTHDAPFVHHRDPI